MIDSDVKIYLKFHLFVNFSPRIFTLGIPSQRAERRMMRSESFLAFRYELGSTWRPLEAPSGASPVQRNTVRGCERGVPRWIDQGPRKISD